MMEEECERSTKGRKMREVRRRRRKIARGREEREREKDGEGRAVKEYYYGKGRRIVRYKSREG